MKRNGWFLRTEKDKDDYYREIWEADDREKLVRVRDTAITAWMLWPEKRHIDLSCGLNK